jgi:hypothetical protein
VEFELSEYRDDSAAFFDFLRMCAKYQVEFVGFNNLGWDYPILHALILESQKSHTGEEWAAIAYAKAQAIIDAQSNDERFGHMIWSDARFIPQIDLYKVHHFDNIAKRTSLKALQFAMRAESVEDLPIAPGTRLTREQAGVTRRYMRHDIEETKRFLEHSKDALDFRRTLVPQFGSEALNWSDVKIGAEMVISRIGKNKCYYYDVDDKRQIRQTKRDRINVADIILPTIRFERRECRDLLERFRATVITNTRAAVKDSVELDGFAFHFGTGGVHGSRDKSVFRSDAEHVIIDADVTSLYPSIAIEYGLYPEHLGVEFVGVYGGMKAERLRHAKGTAQNAALKLALNGTYGNSNNPWSPFYDPQYTMQTTINGQLFLFMLAERLLTVPSLRLIQINTDGVTYCCLRSQIVTAKEICDAWSRETRLELEFVEYAAMFVRDVNSYVAVGVDGKVKRKGAYDFPTSEQLIGTATSGPRAWHGDQSAMIVPMAASAHLTDGRDIDEFIAQHTDHFDFMLRFKTPRSSKLLLGDRPQQRVTRYYAATDGLPLAKESPPVEGREPGQYKQAPKVSDADYRRVMAEIGLNKWDQRIHTKNRSRYEDRRIGVHPSALVCNHVREFDWSRLDREWYAIGARKLTDCFNVEA